MKYNNVDKIYPEQVNRDNPTIQRFKSGEIIFTVVRCLCANKGAYLSVAFTKRCFDGGLKSRVRSLPLLFPENTAVLS